jgi:hypothetical protein
MSFLHIDNLTCNPTQHQKMIVQTLKHATDITEDCQSEQQKGEL